MADEPNDETKDAPAHEEETATNEGMAEPIEKPAAPAPTEQGD